MRRMVMFLVVLVVWGVSIGGSIAVHGHVPIWVW